MSVLKPKLGPKPQAGVCELAAAELAGLSHGGLSSPAWHVGDPNNGDGAKPVRQVTLA